MNVPDRPPYVMVITGTSRGIGKGIAEHFARIGYAVAGCSRSEASITEDHYDHYRVDVSDENAVRKWVRSVRQKYGRIDVLVTSAAVVAVSELMGTTSAATLEQTFRTNVYGTYYVCREVVKTMILQRYGRIITMSSMAAGLHQEGTSAYSASKSAVAEFTKILAKEVAAMNITCNVIAPSIYGEGAALSVDPLALGRAEEKLTIKRDVTIEEICSVVAFFSAPENGSITGQVLYMGLAV